MIKRGSQLIATALFACSVALVGCEEKPGEFREVPEDGPPPIVDMGDPGNPNANPADSIAPPPPSQN